VLSIVDVDIRVLNVSKTDIVYSLTWNYKCARKKDNTHMPHQRCIHIDVSDLKSTHVLIIRLFRGTV